MTVDGTDVHVAFPKTKENHTRSLLNGFLIEMGYRTKHQGPVSPIHGLPC